MKNLHKSITFLLLILILLLSACSPTPSDVVLLTPVDTAQNASATSDSSAVTELTHYDANSSVTNNSSQYDNPPDISYIDDAPTATEFIVYFLDVGQAAAAFIYSDGETMLIDGGGASSSNLIYSFLDRHGIDHLDYIINTHPHEDHVGGLSGALNRVSSVGVALGSATAYDTRAFNSFLSNLDNHGVELTIPKAGNSFMLGTATVEILAHLRDYNDVNNNSIVIKITYGETRFLFLGDAERASELDMVEAGLNLSATVLKVGHHGSDTSTIYPFLREVMPEIAVISCGSDNRYGHPHDNVLSRLRDASVKVYRTDLQGDIIIRSDGFNLSVETQRNANIPTNPTALPVDDYSYIGNINSKRFHRLDCRTLPAEHNRVHLESREHAIENGFDPCGNCKP